ncbi:hypothetical protein ACFRJ9_21705, partial [Paenarthrobacter sp. NPDC056912]|uniref:hypothetical protein n=1 Tax=Paenarthrobacter sp. NPDC056912 TaxID=3345965 RepID=UPI00366D1AB8
MGKHVRKRNKTKNSKTRMAVATVLVTGAMTGLSGTAMALADDNPLAPSEESISSAQGTGQVSVAPVSTEVASVDSSDGAATESEIDVLPGATPPEVPVEPTIPPEVPVEPTIPPEVPVEPTIPPEVPVEPTIPP